MSRTIPFSQYETNLWSTHVNIVRLAEPIRRCVRWRTQVFKIEGFVCKRFLPSLPPPPTFIFLALVSFLARPKPRIPFLGLSLLRNQKETLATQANKEREFFSDRGYRSILFLAVFAWYFRLNDQVNRERLQGVYVEGPLLGKTVNRRMNIISLPGCSMGSDRGER